jgi:hypothetical protein
LGLGVAGLAVVLVGGRWLAFETAERVWAASLQGGRAYVTARDFARLVSGLVRVVTVAWSTGNLLFVYRAIGSMQLSRRLGDLEIVEAVPQPLLLAGTLGCGVVFGLLLALGTGDWWMSAAIAAKGVRFGVVDPVLGRDVGYYVAALPWGERLRALALVAECSAVLVVALLYAGIGSLRVRRWLPYANAHVRAHLGLLLALLAATLTWGAVLDPAETVAGLHGALPRSAFDARLAAAPFVTALGALTVVVSIIWGLRERPVWLLAAWGTLFTASLLGFVVIPASLASAGPRGAPAAARDTARAAAERRMEALAFGVGALVERAPPGFASPAAAVRALPVWNAARVLAAARRRDQLGPRAQPVAVALSAYPLGDGHATWIVALAPDGDALAHTQPPPDWGTIHRGAWTHTGRPLAALEDDGNLAFETVPTRDSTVWFGPGFAEFAVAAPDTWPALARAGIPLAGWWRRLALAWVLQSPGLARRETDDLVLLWRRDVTARLEQLAPFARFAPPTPVVADGALWWLSYGELEAETFPLVQPVEPGPRPVRYRRVALVGSVKAASGDTRLYLAPGADSLATAWAALVAPLIRPGDSLPAGLRAQLPFPDRAFRAAALAIERWRADTVHWRARPREPFELVAPGPDTLGDAAGPRVWAGQGFEAGSTVVALVAATLSPHGPRLFVWQPRPPTRLPPVLVGSPNTTAPGVARLWNVGGTLFFEQALFLEPATGGPPSGIDTVFLAWGERHGQGRGPAAALRDLVAGGSVERAAADTALAARWARAQRLAAEADRALAAGDWETFGRKYTALKALLGVTRGKLAPTPERR